NTLVNFGVYGIYPLSNSNGSIEAIDWQYPNNRNIVFANTNLIRRIDASGKVTTLTAIIPPYVPALLDSPPMEVLGSAITANGAVYITYAVYPDNDYAGYNSATIAQVQPDGEVTTFAGQQLEYGQVDGSAEQALFLNPTALTIDPNGN